jgi:hypothetical protein
MKKAITTPSKRPNSGKNKPHGTQSGNRSAIANPGPDGVTPYAGIITDPLVIVSCSHPLPGYVYLTNSGTAPVTLKVWTQDEGRPGIPEGGLLLEIPLYQGDTITHTGSQVIRYEIEAKGSEAQRRYLFYVRFTANGGVSSPPEFRVHSTKAGKLQVQVYNNARNKWATSVSVLDPGQPRYKTRIDPDVYGILTRDGAEAIVKSHDGEGALPFRFVQFDS